MSLQRVFVLFLALGYSHALNEALTKHGSDLVFESGQPLSNETLQIIKVVGQTKAAKAESSPYSYYYYTISNNDGILTPGGASPSRCPKLPKNSLSSSTDSITLTSPSYPGEIPPNQECSHTITGPTGSRLSISCDEFVLKCSQDDYLFISISDDAEYQVCGDLGILPTIETESNVLKLRLSSGPSYLRGQGQVQLSFFGVLVDIPSISSQYNCKVRIVGSSSPAGLTSALTSTAAAPSLTSGTAVPSTAAAAPAPTSSAPSIPPRPSPQNGKCSCGVRNINGLSRIVGGSRTKNNEIPWRVLVFIYNPSTSMGKRCAGTIISPSWILTAAHCTAKMTPETQLLVFVGAQDDPLNTAFWTKIVSDRYVQHQGYNKDSVQNDIALVHLPTPLQFNDRVSAACLPFKYVSSDFSGTTVLASGWGTTQPVSKGQENLDASSSTLLKVDLGVVPSSVCQYYLGGITENQICTYSPGRDTCQGDSGASIDLTDSDGFLYAIGVVSFGAGCAQAETPGVNTKVTKYLDWIQQNTAGETFCVK